MSTQHIRVAVTAPILISFLLSGCGLMENLLGTSEPRRIDSIEPQSNTSFDSGASGLGQNIRSDDGEVQISLPSSWRQIDGLHRNAEIQAARESNDLYTLVLAEDKANLDKFTLENNATTYRRLLIAGLDQFVEETPTEANSVNNNNAVQYVIEGVYEGVPITYLHSTVATQRAYYQIISWTDSDRFEDNRDEFEQIAESFREN
ncbi:MAG: hypothetical protein HC873_22140 [Leptolyngbyaceae cyanobacterium SL_1_1]|nr:hypothetical protein [Leptolyngbyaceae cyanobacterium RM1_1_2]NJO11871.1 hypothetical protein [Leptolyngbyaceae cyanobacterium SL_1_1]